MVTHPIRSTWSNGETTEDLDDVPPGTYTVTITDDNGCTGTAEAVVGDDPIAITIDGTVVANTTCNGGNGSINTTVTPSGNYTYNWSNGETTEDLDDLEPGTYTLTVTLGVNCTQTASFTIDDDPDEPMVNFTVTETTCDLANGDIDVSVSGGVPPYTFSWSNGETTEDLNDIPAGNYDVTVTGANGCTGTSNITVNNNNPPINISGAVVVNTTCNGGNGSITLTVTPPGNYTFNWSNGETTQDLDDLEPGTYTVTVNGGGSCTNTASFTIDDNPDEPMVNFTVTETTCDLANGDIDVSVSGGVPPYTYNWSNGETTQDLNDIPAGTYDVTVTGANGCTGTASITVNNNNPPINISGTVVANTTCNGGNGSITLTVTPPGNYTFNWSNGETTPNLSDLEPGTYTVTVNGGGSCTNTASFTIDDTPDEPMVNFTVTDPTCDLPNGDIDVSVSGGVPPYTYNWSNGETTQDLNDIPAGNYDVTVTGANGCTGTANIAVNNNNPPINISATVNANTACIGGSGSIILTVTPPGNYTYNWSNGETTPNISDLPPGTYTVTVSGIGSCSNTAAFSVPDQPSAPDPVLDGTDPTCGLSNGSVNLTVFGGQPPYTYLWGGGETTQNLTDVPAGNYSVTVTGANGCTGVNSITLNNINIPITLSGTVTPQTSCITNNGSIQLDLDPPNLSIMWSNGSNQANLNNIGPGTYTVTVSAGGNCTQVASFTIDDLAELPTLTTAVTPATCGFSNGQVDLEVFGGAQPYTYSWSNNANTQDLSMLPGGSYAVTVTTALGCTAVTVADVQNESINIQIFGVVSDNISCSSPNGFIDIDVSPPDVYTYQWSNFSTQEDLDNLSAGTYTVTVSIGVGCTAAATFEVYDNANPPNLSTSTTQAICGEDNGTATVSASGGSAPYDIQWSNNANTATISNLAPGTYTVTVTGFFGCSSTASATVTNTNIAVNIDGTVTPNTSCLTANGGVDIDVTPPAPYTFTWSDNSTDEDLSNVGVGTYTVTVSAGAGCSATASFTVGENTADPVIEPTITPSICGLSNGGIDLTISGGSAPFDFDWSNNETSEDLVDILSGNYSVTVTDANGCSADTTLNVPNNASTFSLAGVATALTSCVSDNGAIDLTVTPAGTYTYLWSNNATTEDISDLPAGTYTVSVTESGSCTASASFIVNDELTFPSLNQTITPELCDLTDGAIDLTVSGGATPYTYNWSGGDVTEDLTGIVAGDYTVTVTGANGCTETTSVTVPANSINFAIAGAAVPDSSCVVENGSIDITLSPADPGAGPGYSFSWSNNASTEDLSAIGPGTYTITVSAGGSCTSEASFTVANDALPPSISENVGLALCGQNSGSINLTISGGLAPFTFIWSNNETSEDLSDLAQGSYTVTVTGANGCTTTNSFTVDEDVVVPDVSGVPADNNSCVSPNGTINLSVSPASLQYTFNWSNAQTTQNLTDLSPGTYTVTVNGGGSCSNTATFTVGENILPPVIADSISAALCGQNSGAIDLTISNGISPYTFEWSNLASVEDLNGIASGTYTVTVSGANGCTETASYTVPDDVVVPDIVGTLAPNSSCVVDNGAITLEVNPTTLTYTYNWESGETTPDLADLPPGTYTVTVNGGGACTAVSTFTIDDITVPVTVSGTTTDILCFGDNAGAIDLTVSSGAAPFTFAWSPDIPGAPEDPVGLLAGDYTVVVTDTAGCTTTETFTINQPLDAVSLACTQSSNVSSPGATDGAAAITISGGIAPYAIEWSPGSTQSNLSTGVFPITNLGVGDYDVTVTDANGCTAICSFNISIINCQTAVGLMQGNVLSLCGQGCITANYNSIGQFLEPGDILQFILHEGNGTQVVNELARSDQPSFCFDPNLMTYGTTYYISAAAGDDDGAGNVLLSHFCTVVSAGTPIVFQEKPNASAVQPGPLSCAVDQVAVAGSSDIPGSTFQWSTSNGQIIGNASQAAIDAGSAGTYMLIVEANGCADTTTVDVLDISNQPEAEILASPNDILDCAISEIILSGDIKGTNDANSVWQYNGSTFAVGTSLTIDAPGVYEFIIVDTVTFCADTAIIQIDQNLDFPPLFVNPPDMLDCINSTITLSGGSSFPGVQFSWASVNGTDTTLLGSGASIDVTMPGDYILIGFDPVSSCTNAVGTQVSADLTDPVANAGAPFSIDCFGETASLDGSASTGGTGLQYQWSTQDGNLVSGLNTPTPQIDLPGTYNLLVTDPGNGCTDTDQVIIDPDDPEALATAHDAPCVGDLGMIVIDTVIGGQPPINYSIDGGQTYTTQSFFTNLQPGSYTILVQDANGCQTSVDATLNAPQLFEINLDPQVTIQLGESYQIETEVTPPLSTFNMIQWTPGTGLDCDTCLNPVATPLTTTQYRITVISNNGCEDDASLLLVVDRRPNVYIPNVFSPNGDGQNDVFRIYADSKSVKQVKSFQIYSRWGEMVYEYYNFDPNAPGYGWDGRHRGQDLNPAVFVYYAVIEFIDGQEILYEGDVTIVR